MLYHLSNGKKIEVWFNHKYETDAHGNPKPFMTECEVILDNETLLIDHSVCHPNDQFSKSAGRLVAFKKILSRIQNPESQFFDAPLLTKQERGELFKLVFPKLTTQGRRKRKHSSQFHADYIAKVDAAREAQKEYVLKYPVYRKEDGSWSDWFINQVSKIWK